MAAETTLMSPRLAALLADPSPATSAALLREMHERGGPLVEPLQGVVDRRGVPCSRVTFLYEAAGAGGVTIATPLNDAHPNEAMQHVPGTDLWWASRIAADDVRVTYQFCADDPLLDLDFEKTSLDFVLAALEERFPRTAADPANPDRIRPYGERWNAPPERWLSVLTLSRTPPDPWHEPRPEVPAGSVVRESVESRVLGNERQVWLYTPPGYRPDGGPYPLVVLLDGRELHRVVEAPTIADNLVAENRIRPPVLAIVENATELSRFTEYFCSDSFTEFLTDELLPWVRARCGAIASDAGSVVIGGVSAGGLASAHAAWSRPDRFGAVVSLSGAFSYAKSGDVEGEWLTRQIAAAERRPVRWWTNVGDLERKPNADA
jgi:enterochelin esterase family protein